MAVVPQRRQSNYYRPPVRPVDVADVRGRAEATPLPLSLSLAFVAVPTALLILYVSTFAQMAEASFRKLKLLEQLRGARTEMRLLNTELKVRSSKEGIETWALANGMERGQGPLVLAAKVAQKGR